MAPVIRQGVQSGWDKRISNETQNEDENTEEITHTHDRTLMDVDLCSSTTQAS